MRWLVATVVVWLLGCTGPAGPTGPTGPTGAAGVAPSAREVAEELLRSPELRRLILAEAQKGRAATGPSPAVAAPAVRAPASNPTSSKKLRQELNCDTVCKTYGSCTKKDGRCTAASEAECRQSRGCRMMGNCSFFPDGENVYSRCLPGSDADCQQSDICTGSGQCTLREGRCSK